MKLLVRSRGDPQALKCLLAAKAASAQVEVVECAEQDILKAIRDANAVYSGRFPMVLQSDGVNVTCPNTAARLVGASLIPKGKEALLDSVLEREETLIRPAAYGLAAKVAAARDALGSLERDVKEAGPLAQIAVACTLAAAGAARVDLGPTAAAIAQLAPEAAASAASDVVAADVKALAKSTPKVPLAGARNILVTSALPYVNNVPHLGNIIGCVLSADVYARFARSRGYNVVYVCGTDEYGTATETKALEEGLTEQQICDKYHAIHKSIYEWFDIDFDKFGRTPTRSQTEIAQSIFLDLHKNGLLKERETEQLFSPGLGKFLADRYVVGTCPKCKYEDARGDQCDACGSLLNPTELINPKCKFSGTTPVLKPTKHVFLDLPAIEPRLREYVEKMSSAGGWSTNCVTTTNAWIRDGLQQRCITRDLRWGTPVPLPGFEKKVFYVWFDAPIGYISITANYTPDWERWWRNPEDVELVQFMGKDNVPFHTVIFPCTQLGTGRDWTMMRSISVTEYLNYEGGKFSKSRGTGVFGNDAKDTGIPPEVWRYYLLVNRPETADTDFRWDDLAAKNNSELLNNLGNFVNRTLSYCAARLGGRVPAPSPKAAAVVAEMSQKVHELTVEYVDALEKVRLKEGIRTVMSISAVGNKYLQDNKHWDIAKTDPEHAGGVLLGALGLTAVLASLVQPYMPSLTRKILAQMNLDWDECTRLDAAFIDRTHDLSACVPQGHVIGAPAPLFQIISNERVEELRARYGGAQVVADGPAAKPTDKAPDAKGKGKESSAKEGGKGAKEGGKGKGNVDGAKEGGKGAKEGGKKAAEDDRAVDLSRVDLRVGKILKAWKHPDAESLYIEEIDLGEGKPRQVVSGLVKYIPEEQMQGRSVVCVCNLKAAKMRGVESQAMVLCGESADGATVELVEPPAGAQPGDRVSVEGFPGEPDEQLNPKKKIFEAVSAECSSDASRVVTYRGKALATAAGACTLKTVVGAKIR